MVQIPKKTFPTQIGTETDWLFVETGSSHTLSIKTDGSMWGFGQNEFGNFGDGTTRPTYTPVKITTALGWLSMSIGEEHSVAIINDQATTKPVLHNPLQNSYSGRNLKVAFTLPEDAIPGAVQLYFTRTGGEADENSPHIVTLGSFFEKAARHILTLDGNQFSATSDVISVNNAPNDGLVSGAVYTVTSSYQNQYNHAAATDENTGVIYDVTSPAQPLKPELVSTRDTGISNADGITKDDTPGIRGTVEANALVTVYVDDHISGTSWAQASGNWEYTIPRTAALITGTYLIKITATDAAGNSSDPSEPLTIYIDMEAPTVLTKDAVLQLNSDCLATLTVEDIDAGSSDNFTDQALLVFTISKTSFSCEEVGEHQLTLKLVDQAGKVSYAPAKVMINSSITGLFDNEKQHDPRLLVYPNPTNGSVKLKADDIEDEDKVTFSIVTPEGRMLLSRSTNLRQATGDISTYLEEASAGIYLLQIVSREKVSVIRIIRN